MSKFTVSVVLLFDKDLEFIVQEAEEYFKPLREQLDAIDEIQTPKFWHVYRSFRAKDKKFSAPMGTLKFMCGGDEKFDYKSAVTTIYDVLSRLGALYLFDVHEIHIEAKPEKK